MDGFTQKVYDEVTSGSADLLLTSDAHLAAELATKIIRNRAAVLDVSALNADDAAKEWITFADSIHGWLQKAAERELNGDQE